MSRFRHRGWLFQFLATRKLAGLVFLALAVFVFVSAAPAPQTLETAQRVALTASSPILQFFSQPVLVLRRWGRSSASYLTAWREVKALRAEVEELRQWRERAVKAESLLGNYEAILRIKPDSAHNYIGARVFADLGGAYRRSLIVNIGTRDGIQVGQAAMGPTGFVGRIIAASTRASRILLVTDVNSHIAVLVGKQALRAVMSGDGTEAPFLEFLDDESALAPDDVVATSGHDGYIPAGLPVGRMVQQDGGWRVRLWEHPVGLEHVRIAELPQIFSPGYQDLPLQLAP